MNALCPEPQPPPTQTPFKFSLQATSPDHIHDDAWLALQDIKSYLTKMGLTLTIEEINDTHFVYTVNKNLAHEKSMILEIMQFKSHGHWLIKEESTTCQEKP